MMHPDHTDYDSRRLAVERARAAAMAMASVKRPYRAKGLDDQGRHPEALHDVAPAPAEAATDIGSEHGIWSNGIYCTATIPSGTITVRSCTFRNNASIAQQNAVRPWTAEHLTRIAIGTAFVASLIYLGIWVLRLVLIAMGVRV